MTTRLRGIPPGRAGQPWLRHRLAMAERAAELLERKLRILRTEQERLVLLEQRTLEAWSHENRQAQLWAERTVLLGGDRAIRLDLPQEAATVTLTFATSMGLRYPDDAHCTLPAPANEASPMSNAASGFAIESHGRALEAAVRHAAARSARRIVEAEQKATRLRLRGLQDRWIPRLQDAAHELTLGLEEGDHADAVRLRWSNAQLAGPVT